MDIVQILESGVSKLPEGDYTIGLNAIVRHVKTAIRHFERDQQHDPDTCTDAIYRTNQAYEGSLKEAYRVLAGKDPSGLSPHQIELYLETHSVVRPRVLTQFTRYRHDYRNPSAHDYKLDFDNDEALLAIVSVCAFATLLTEQIASKLASNAAQKKAAPSRRAPQRATLKSLARQIASIALTYTQESTEVAWFEFARGLAESLSQAGIPADAAKLEDQDSTFWDVLVKKGKSHFGIDARMTYRDFPEEDPSGFASIRGHLGDEHCVGALMIFRARASANYKLYKGTFLAKPAFAIVADDDFKQQEALSTDAKDLSPTHA